MEKTNTLSPLQKQKTYFNTEIDKFISCLHSGFEDVKKDIKTKEIVQDILKQYIEHTFHLTGGNNVSFQKGFRFSSIYLNCYNYEIRKENSEDTKKDIDKIVKDFINNVIQELNTYSKKYTFYLVEFNYSIFKIEKDYKHVKIDLSFSLTLF